MRKYLFCFKMRLLNLFSIVLLCIAVGTGFFIEFFVEQNPCILCFLQRICMMGTGFGLYLNVVFGVRVKHYGFSLLWALLGLVVSLRHVSLSICRPVEEGDFLFWSLRVPMWSFITFFMSLIGITAFLCFYKNPPEENIHRKNDFLTYTATSLILVILSIGFFSVFRQLGWQLMGL